MPCRATIAGVPIIAVLILGLVALSGCGGSDDAAAQEELAPGIMGTGGQMQTVGAAPRSLTASRLAGDYIRNEAAADAQYKGALLEISGLVLDSGRTPGNVLYVTLNGIVGLPIQCNFPESESDAVARLSNAQQVTLRGTGEGFVATDVQQEGQRGIFMVASKPVTLNGCAVVE